MLKNLNKTELLQLLEAYDSYIQDANDGNRYILDGFYPVCIAEFYNNDFNDWRKDGEDR